jgi:hypothetical protein
MDDPIWRALTISYMLEAAEKRMVVLKEQEAEQLRRQSTCTHDNRFIIMFPMGSGGGASQRPHLLGIHGESIKMCGQCKLGWMVTR